MRTRVSVVALLLALLAAAPAANAEISCGAEKTVSKGQVFAITASGTNCRIARSVAGGWFNVRFHGKSGRTVYDADGRRWSCRVTLRATGTDPGYNPYTHIRCARKRSVVRFKLRS